MTKAKGNPRKRSASPPTEARGRGGAWVEAQADSAPAEMQASSTPEEMQSSATPASTWSKPAALVWIGVGLGLAFEILFYGKRLGISSPLWAGLSILGMLLASRLERIQSGKLERWLPIPIMLFASMVFVRTEPLTVALSITSTLGLLTVWVRTFRSGDLLGFGWTDFLLALIVVPLESWIRPWSVLSQAQGTALSGKRGRANALALLRGAVLALPVLFVFTALLSQADLIFADRVEQALRWLDLERVLDYFGRGTVIALAALFSLGAMALALRTRARRAGGGMELIKPFLGFTEAAVVLVTVNLILLLFVSIQVRYLFGGEANITAAGYTYSEYARRGFGELVAVSFLSLGMILSLGTVTLRQVRAKSIGFNALSAALVLLVGVVLASALMRLRLYEAAYGFTRLRTYTHVAIVWMAVLFAAFLALLLTGQLRRFALASAVGTLGFVATLGFLNVDAFIVRQNAGRLAQTGEIDLPYLLSLSEDAVPNLLHLMQRVSGERAEVLSSELGCWRGQLQARQKPWPSLHWSRSAAEWALLGQAATTSGSSVWRSNWGTWVHMLEGDAVPCLHQAGIPNLR